jgi:hypothetical protein
MNDVDRDELEISAVAAMTDAEVREELRQYGLRPIEQLPPDLIRLRAAARRRLGVTAEVVEGLEEVQGVAAATPDRDAARKNPNRGAVWAWMRWQFQWLKNAYSIPLVRRTSFVTALSLLAVAITFGLTAVVNRFNETSPNRVITVDFSAAEEQGIREAMRPLFTPRCTRAFARAGLRSPLDVATHEGAIVMPSSDLYYYSARSLGLMDRRTQMAYRDQFSSVRAQAGTVPHVLYGVPLTVDGRARIFLHDSAFAGESWLFRRLSLNGVLAHEFIHVGGQPPAPGWLFGTDLDGYEHYEEIMDACTSGGGR